MGQSASAARYSASTNAACACRAATPAGGGGASPAAVHSSTSQSSHASAVGVGWVGVGWGWIVGGRTWGVSNSLPLSPVIATIEILTATPPRARRRALLAGHPTALHTCCERRTAGCAPHRVKLARRMCVRRRGVGVKRPPLKREAPSPTDRPRRTHTRETPYARGRETGMLAAHWRPCAAATLSHHHYFSSPISLLSLPSTRGAERATAGAKKAKARGRAACAPPGAGGWYHP